MSTNAGAFAPGNPAGGASVTSMTIPPLNFQTSSSARSGDISQGFGLDNSGFSVNYGSGVAQGSSGLLLIVAAVIVGAILWKKR